MGEHNVTWNYLELFQLCEIIESPLTIKSFLFAVSHAGPPGGQSSEIGENCHVACTPYYCRNLEPMYPIYMKNSCLVIPRLILEMASMLQCARQL